MDSLPDDCIFALLQPNFPLSKLIRLRAVSTKWKKIVEKICLSKTELNLFSAVLDMVNVYKDADPYRLMKKADLRQLAPNLLTLSKTAKAPKADEFIGSLFPHVTKLVCGLEDSIQVVFLLHYWSGSLEDLTIIGKLQEKQLHPLFWKALNLMPKLKRLVFHDITATENYQQHIPYAYFVPPFVTVFNQLEHFAITGRADQVYDIFGYKKPKHGRAVAAVPLKHQNRALEANLTHLVLTDKSGSINTTAQPPVIRAILASTDALRYLDVSDLDFKLTDLMPELMRKTNLESIRIKLTQLIPGHDIIRLNIRLNSVKRLHLIDTKVTEWLHTEKPNYRQLPLLFPSLEHLEVATKDVKLMKHFQAIFARSVVLSFVSTANN